MALLTRKILINLREIGDAGFQSCAFTPELTGGSGEMLLAKTYRARIDRMGRGEIDLPVKSAGAVRYQCQLAADNKFSEFAFDLTVGGDITLDTLFLAGNPVPDSQPIYDFVNQSLANKINTVPGKTNLIPVFDAGGGVTATPVALGRQTLSSRGVDASFDAVHLPMLFLETTTGTLNGLYEYALIPVDENGFEQFGLADISVQRKQVTNKAIRVVSLTFDGRAFGVAARARRYRRKADADGVFSDNWRLIDDSSAYFIVDNSDAAGVPSAAPLLREFAGGVRSRLDIFRTAQSFLQIPRSVTELKPAVWLSPKFNRQPDGTSIPIAESIGGVGGAVYADRNPKPTAATELINGIPRPVWNFSGGECYLGTFGGQDARRRGTINYPRGLAALRHDSYSSGVSFMLLVRETVHVENYRTLFRVRNSSSGRQNVLFLTRAARNDFYVTGNAGAATAGAGFDFDPGNYGLPCPEWNLLFFAYDSVNKTINFRRNGYDFPTQNVPEGEVWQTFIPEFFIGGDYHYGNAPCQFAEVILDDQAWDGSQIRTLESDFKREYNFTFASAATADEVIFDGGGA